MNLSSITQNKIPNPMGEFDLIQRYFASRSQALVAKHPSVVAGIGDDCALLSPPATKNMQWAISTDMLLEGRHFFADTNPYTLGHKALAVNLSDLAACGATPVGFTLALALPKIEDAWLEAFSRGLLTLAEETGCPLLGGDTTQGPLTIAITVFGQVPQGQAILRRGALPGDGIYISGRVGEARLVLEALQGRFPLEAEVIEKLRPRLEAPTPRLALGQALRGIATAAIDLSDGLAGDLSHVLEASGVSARIDTSFVFHSSATGPEIKDLPPYQALTFCLGGGDDYELLFTAPPEKHTAVLAAAQASQTPVTQIGHITDSQKVLWLNSQGQVVTPHWTSFAHFKAS